MTFALSYPDEGLALLTLDNPEASNALTVPLVRQLRETIEALGGGQEVRVLVLAGRGRNFCAGLDLKAMKGALPDNPGPIDHMALQEEFSGLIGAVANAGFPVIAALQGAVVGAGMGIALAADIRVADPTTRLMIGAVKLGLSAGECGISYHLPRIVGSGRAFDIMLTGRGVEADEALRIGLVTALAEAGTVVDLALGIGREIRANSPYATKHTRQVMRANLDASCLASALELENHVQCLALGTSDFDEACRAFVEKRTPVFRGR